MVKLFNNLQNINIMKIELEDTLKNNLEQGLNLFAGAGFSILAKDKKGNNLPLGNKLRDELAEYFKQPASLELSQLSTIIESIKPIEFKKFLRERFEVIDYNKKYNNLKKINIKSIYTTNIDNLINKIYAGSLNHYLNDITTVGPSFKERIAIDFAPLHGTILESERKLVFNTVDLSTTFNNEQATWYFLRNKISEFPTLFVGYSLADASVIQALYSNQSKIKPHSSKWILIYEDDEASRSYFKTLGFNIIQGSTEEFLDYLNSYVNTNGSLSKKLLNNPRIVFPKESVPEKSSKLPVRPLKYYFLGAEPYWSDIYNNRIPRTSYYEKIINEIHGNKNVIILGIPASGKTTLMMQIAAHIKFYGIKLICNNMTREKAHLITSRLRNDKALIFIDNFTDNIDTFNHFEQFENIRLVGFDRHYNYEIISHHIDEENFSINNITPIEPRDIQTLYSKIPTEIRKRSLINELKENIEPSIFDFINLNTTFPNINVRYRSVIEELENDNKDLCDLLVMLCYVNACRTIVSFDMALSFMGDSIEHYDDVYDCFQKLDEIVVDYEGSLLAEDQDYFTPRSSIISGAILNQVSQKTFQRMFIRFHTNISRYSIYRYDIFKKYGYDSNFIKKAFPNWREGKEFYETVFESDKSPFILQQGALYLASKKKFQDAFKWIDEAILISKNKFFSIRNTHAIILFQANINTEDKLENVRASLDESMKILSRCYNDDKRKLYHALTFSRQAIKYYAKYADDIALDYIASAKKWLLDEKKNNPWNWEVKKLLKEIEPIT